jgi:hypothetical protein
MSSRDPGRAASLAETLTGIGLPRKPAVLLVAAKVTDVSPVTVARLWAKVDPEAFPLWDGPDPLSDVDGWFDDDESVKLSSGSVLIPPSSHIYFCPPCRAMRNHYAPSMFCSSSPMASFHHTRQLSRRLSAAAD